MQGLAVGIIGAGSIAERHADAIADLNHEMVAVADISSEARDSFATAYDVSETYNDYEQMIGEESLDVVLVSVPNSLHADCAITALDADVNVLVEKPLADTLENARRIANAERESNATVKVGFKKAFEASTEVILDMQHEDEFGEIYEVNVEMVRRRGIPQIGSWFTRKELSGGGAVVDIGPHMIHLALYLLGFPAVEAVSATAGSHFGSDPDYTYLSMWGGAPTGDRTFDVEDRARALVRTADGASIHVNLAWASNREGYERVQVLGGEAGVTFDPGGNTVSMSTTGHGGLVDTDITKPETDEFRRQWEYIADVLAGERTHDINTVKQGVAVQQVIDGMYRSAERGREVRLENNPHDEPEPSSTRF